MRWFITGATGLVGQQLIESGLKDGVQIRALSRSARSALQRSPRSAGSQVEWLRGDPAVASDWVRGLEGCDAVFHFAGEPIAEGRWTSEKKRRLIASRVDSTRVITAAIRKLSQPPRALVCASAVGYYGPRGEEALDESSAPGDDYLAKLCVEWEAAAAPLAGSTTRLVHLRIGIVLSARGGALAKLLPIFRLGVGGPIGNPQHWFPWVHLDDVVGLARFAADRDVSGALNAVAPGSARMGEFARALGRALRRPALLPTPILPLRILLGEFAGSLNPGQKILPRRPLELGYRFRHPQLAEALAACVREERGAPAPDVI